MVEKNKLFEELDRQLALANDDNCYTFELLVEDPKYKRIHPIKQKQLHNLIKALLTGDQQHHITDIIVFGSCLSLFCHTYSDIDLMVLGRFDEFHPGIDLHPFGHVDLFGYNRALFIEQLDENKFFKKIWERGYKIYEQLSTSS